MTPNISVSHITLYSTDTDRTAQFYNKLGLNLQKSGGWGGGYHYLDILRTGDQRVFFKIYSKKIGSEVMDSLGFEVDNVAETLARLIELGVTVLRPGNPRVHKHATVAAVKDPDGRVIGLYQKNR